MDTDFHYVLGTVRFDVVSPLAWMLAIQQRRGVVGKFWPELPDEVIKALLRIRLEGGINWSIPPKSCWGRRKVPGSGSRTIGTIARKVINATKCGSYHNSVIITNLHQ